MSFYRRIAPMDIPFAFPRHAENPMAPDTSSPAARWAIASLAASMLLSSLGVSIANVALPTLTQAFAASFAEVQWVVLAYLLAITVTIVNAGRLGDTIGHRPMVLAGILLFTAASVLGGMAPTLWTLVAARVLQGVGAAILMTISVAIVREIVPTERTGSAMGLLGTMSAIGTAIGPSLGGVLIAGAGWRSIFFAMALLGSLAFPLAWRGLPRPARHGKVDPKGFDGAGSLLLGLSLAAYTLAMTLGGHDLDGRNGLLLLAAGAGAALFLRLQARRPSPLVPLATFRDAGLSASLATNMLVATVMMATLVVGPFDLSRGLGLNEALVGLVMSVGPVISAMSGVPAGRIVDRMSAPFMVMLGLILMVAGCLALSLLPGILGVWGYIAAIAVLTPGYQMFQASNNTVVMTGVAPDRKGVVSGLLGLSRNLGLITGASVMGAVFAFAAAADDMAAASPEAVATGMEATFAVSAVLILAGLGIAAATRVVAPNEA
jgi:MFS family permease